MQNYVLAMSQLIPGTSCDISLLQKEAEKAEQSIKETDEESRHLKRFNVQIKNLQYQMSIL